MTAKGGMSAQMSEEISEERGGRDAGRPCDERPAPLPAEREAARASLAACGMDGVADGDLADRLEEMLARLATIDMDDAQYECCIREAVAMGNPLTASQARSLLEAYSQAAGAGEATPALMLPYFYACFEWYHRNEKDETARLAAWKRLFFVSGTRYEGLSLFHYARSRYHRAARRPDEALADAQAAAELAVGHMGFTNNYGEILLEQTEGKVLSGQAGALSRENARRDDFEALIDSIDRLEAEGRSLVYPSFFITKGRLCGCIGRFDEAESCFVKARGRLDCLRAEGNPRFAAQEDYMDTLGAILQAQSTMAALRASFAVRQSLDEARQEVERKTKELAQRTEELDGRLNDQQVNMLEFLGFFSGIISFIIASIQIGGDMDFGSRAALIVVMLGSLLIAFGALGWLIEGRLGSSARATEASSGAAGAPRRVATKPNALILVGIAVLLIGVVIHLVAR